MQLFELCFLHSAGEQTQHGTLKPVGLPAGRIETTNTGFVLCFGEAQKPTEKKMRFLTFLLEC